ncbi:SlyX family protein [Endomicrobium sp. AH-315-J14]|nr:SlyX family protein [Endomicrobium sp. AH-315-J14]
MSDNDRITELEIKLTHQEDLLETLNQVVIEQAKQIESLKRSIEHLEHQGSGDDNQAGPADEKPPHY